MALSARRRFRRRALRQAFAQNLLKAAYLLFNRLVGLHQDQGIGRRRLRAVASLSLRQRRLFLGNDCLARDRRQQRVSIVIPARPMVERRQHVAGQRRALDLQRGLVIALRLFQLPALLVNLAALQQRAQPLRCARFRALQAGIQRVQRRAQMLWPLRVQRTAEIEESAAVSRAFFACQIVFQALRCLGIAPQMEQGARGKKARVDIAPHDLIERGKGFVKAPLLKGGATLDAQQDLAFGREPGVMSNAPLRDSGVAQQPQGLVGH